MNSLLPKTSISALLLSAALIIAIALPLQSQSTSYVPALQAREGADLGLALVNPTLSEARVTLTARDYTGAIIRNDAITNPVTLALPASGQIAVRAAQLFGSSITGQAGWLEVWASTPAVKGVFSAFNSGFSFIELGEFARPASRLIFPKVSGSSATELTLVNTASEDVQATLSLYRNDGQSFSTKSITIPAFSGFTRSIDELALSAANFEGYAVIDSGVGPGSGRLESLIGFETYGNGSDIALVRALPESSRLRTGYMAHFVSQGGYSSKLTLVNFSGDSQVLRITASGLQAGGSPQTPSSATVDRILAPNARLEESVEQMFSFPGQALIDGYIRFETGTNTSGVFGFLDYGTTDGVALSAIEAQGEGYSNLFFLQVAEGASYYTGLALLNLNNESSIVTLDTFDASGNRTGSTVVNLNPGERVARLLSGFLQGDFTQFGGYVRITATRPVFALGPLGSSNPPTLASVPAQGESLKPQTGGGEVDASLGANVISSDGSTSLLIPSKSLKSNTSINVAPISINGLPSPSGRQPIAAVEATPDGTQFQIPVRLTFPLNVNLDRGTKIPLLTFDPQTRTYQATEFVATVDKSGRTASAEVTRFTNYVASISGSLVMISSIIPSTPVSPGDTITIKGSGFCSSRPQTSVTFAGANNTSLQGTVLSVSATSIQAQVPAGAVSGPVTVHACKQTSTGYTITVASAPAPSSTPFVNAGPNQTISLPSTASLSGTATGFPTGSTLTQTWSTVSGTGTVTFSDATALATAASFSTSGPYTLQLTVSGGGVSASGTTIITVSPATTTSGPVYYVSTTGNDANAGSVSAPWLTIQKAANTVAAGATVNVSAGTYNERIKVTRSGASGSPITFQGQGSVLTHGFEITANYIRVIGFDISTTTGGFPQGMGVYIFGAHNDILNNYIHNTCKEGIWAFGDSTRSSSTTSFNTIQGNTIFRAQMTGIMVEGQNNLVESNDISHTLQTPPGCGTSGDADGIRYFGVGHTIRKNHVHDILLSESPTAHVDATQTWGPAQNMVFEQNVFDIPNDIIPGQTVGLGFTMESIDGPVDGLIIRNNVFINHCTGYAVDTQTSTNTPLSNLTIVNNTIVRVDGLCGGGGGMGIWITSKVQNAIVKNNAFYDYGYGGDSYIRVTGGTGLDIGYNSVYLSNGSTPGGAPYPNDVWNIDPKFVNVAAGDVHLQSTSPLIDKALTLSTVTNDLDGFIRPYGPQPDIGACEYHP